MIVVTLALMLPVNLAYAIEAGDEDIVDPLKNTLAGIVISA